MNYGPTAYCFDCKRVVAKEQMDFIDRTHRRKACKDCREKRERFVELARKGRTSLT